MKNCFILKLCSAMILIEDIIIPEQDNVRQLKQWKQKQQKQQQQQQQQQQSPNLDRRYLAHLGLCQVDLKSTDQQRRDLRLIIKTQNWWICKWKKQREQLWISRAEYGWNTKNKKKNLPPCAVAKATLSKRAATTFCQFIFRMSTKFVKKTV